MELIKPKFISFEKSLPRLFKHLPGIIRGCFYAITSGTGVGKTKLAKFLFVSHAYNYCKENNIPLKVIYFALEESVEKFWISITSDLIKEKYGTTITYYQYKRLHEGLTPEIMKQIESVQPIIDDMKKYIFIENVYNPTGIKITVEEYLKSLGEKKISGEFTDKSGNKNKTFEFKYHDEDTHVIVVIDHNILLTPEKNEYNDCSTVHLAIDKMSKYAIKYFCKIYNCAVCIVHQQESNNENSDNIKLDNLQPTLSKLGMNKIVQQDYHVVLSLFNPSRFKLTNTSNYKGYNILKLQNNFRELAILKHRDGDEGVAIPLFFDGRINYFKELPLPDNDKLKDVYEYIKTIK